MPLTSCGINMCKHSPYVYQVFGIYGINAKFGGHIHSSRYFTIRYEVGVADGRVWACVCNNVWPTSPYSMLAVQAIFAMWHP